MSNHINDDLNFVARSRHLHISVAIPHPVHFPKPNRTNFFAHRTLRRSTSFLVREGSFGEVDKGSKETKTTTDPPQTAALARTRRSSAPYA